MNKNLLIKIENISSGYGSTVIVNNFSFEVEQGQILSITGSNGMGKTTLMKTIMGLIDAKEGKITFKDEDITNSSPDHRSKSGIGYVPQGREIFSSLTVEQNIMLPIYTRKKLPFSPQDKLEEIYSLFPILKEKRNDPANQLSGGQRQMLAFARAMMLKPHLIILDEPSAGLAPNLVSSVFETILTIHKAGVAVLMVEQNAKAALERSNRGYVLATGENRADGTGKSLLKNKEIASLYLGGK